MRGLIDNERIWIGAGIGRAPVPRDGFWSRDCPTSLDSRGGASQAAVAASRIPSYAGRAPCNQCVKIQTGVEQHS